MRDWRDNYAVEAANEGRGDRCAISPPGYVPGAYDDLHSGAKPLTTSVNHNLVRAQKEALYGLAKAPYGSILTNVIMLYMAPNGMSVITIGMVLVLFSTVFKDLYATKAKFANPNVNPYDLNLMRLVYVVGCLGNVCVGMWKLNAMGLLPTRRADWAHWEAVLSSAQMSI